MRGFDRVTSYRSVNGSRAGLTLWSLGQGTKLKSRSVVESRRCFEPTPIQPNPVPCVVDPTPVAGPALQVIGIECSTIIEQARKIVEANGFSDKITLIKSKCEDIKSLEALAGVNKVCVCVCVFLH